MTTTPVYPESSDPEPSEFEGLQTILQTLQNLDPPARIRVFAAVQAFFGLGAPYQVGRQAADPRLRPLTADTHASSFSVDRTPTPKDFLFEKKPQTDVDRIACLAYYLAHYRDTHHFKTLDLSKLNTEAAQFKLSNAAYAVDNAAKAGLLVPASKGAKQLSALGEFYVEALPDRAAARDAIAHAKPKRKPRKGGRSGQPASDETEDSE